jgi:NAD(P)-dependent dehydrogenase (short-subunit alcohol dehydrogenase family)
MKSIRAAGLFLMLCWLGMIVPLSAADNESMSGSKAVLVTGASSGIGRRIAETLAANDYFVFAGARKPEDIEALSEIPNIQGIRLDVTVQSDIDAAVDKVRKAGRGLHGLVNNAGVLITGPSTEVDVERVKWLFDVNVFGVYRVTQAFAPLIIESKGRITMIGSIAGNIGIEFLGPYSMSKHAIEGYTDALASEMERFGVYVSVVAPGDFASNIWKSDIARAKAKEIVGEASPYAADYHRWIDIVAEMELKEPVEVAEAVQHALSADQPRRRYLVVPNEQEMAWVTGSAVQRLVELNEGHPFSYSEEELTNLIRSSIANVSGIQQVPE